MKKTYCCILPVIFILACTSDGTTKSSTDTISGPNLTNVQNVNGNQPDTTAGITLDTGQPSDTSKSRDTVPR
jgi:hypothetical protein